MKETPNTELRNESETPDRPLAGEANEHDGLLSGEALAGVANVKALEDTRRTMMARARNEKSQASGLAPAISHAMEALESAERAEILKPSPNAAAAVDAAQGHLADLQTEARKHQRAAEVLGNEIDRFATEIREARATAHEVVLAELGNHADRLTTDVVEAIAALEPVAAQAILAIRTANSIERGTGQLSITAAGVIRSLEKLFDVTGSIRPSATADPDPKLLHARAVAAFLAPDPERIPFAWLANDEDLSGRTQARLDEVRASKAAKHRDLPSAGSAGMDQVNLDRAASRTRIKKQQDANAAALERRGLRRNPVRPTRQSDLPSAGKQKGAWLQS